LRVVCWCQIFWISTILCCKIGNQTKKDDTTINSKKHIYGDYASTEVTLAKASGKYSIFNRDKDEKENKPIDITKFLT